MLNLMSLLHSLLHYMFMLSYILFIISDMLPHSLLMLHLVLTYLFHLLFIISDMLPHSLLMLHLVLTYLFHLHLLLHPSLSSRYPLSLLHNYLFTSYYYLAYTLSHFHLLHNFIYFHSSSHSLLMIHFHNFIPLHYSMSSNLMSSHSFLHYYLM